MSAAIETLRIPVAEGLTLAADAGGDPRGPGVVLLHGGGQTRHSWGTAMQELMAAGYYVLNLDARGHGESDWSPDGLYTLPRFAADLACVVRTLGAPPALVGASLGAATALYAVGHGPTNFASRLVLVDLVPRIEREGSHKIKSFMRASPEGFASLEEAADAVAAYYPNRPRPKDPSGLLKNLRRRPGGRLHWHWDPAFVKGPSIMEAPGMSESLLQGASRVRIPTLLVRGMQSDIVSQDGIDELRRWMPSLEVCDVTGAGRRRRNSITPRLKDAFNRGVIEFLRRRPAAQP
jgi:pimeloyl-ACP methyl ester carboxylesterase